MSNSPNGLTIRPKVDAIVGSKKLHFLLLGIAVFVVFIVLYSVFTAGKKENKPVEQEQVEIQVESNERMFPTNKGTGLLTPPKKEEPKEELKDEAFPEIKVSRMPEPSEHTKKFIQMREQAYLAALQANLTAYTGGGSSQIEQPAENYTPISAAERPIPPGMAINAGQNSYDVSADIDKEQFFERAQPDNQWINPNIRTAGQKYEIKTGSVIPAAMVTAINSDLPGNMIAQVTQNIYDSATGGYLLIPQGSKLFGVYDSRVIMGQRRVLVAWNRIIFPDGSAMTIPGVPGADMAGNSGFSQKVDNHYSRIFGSSILMALITAGTAYAVDENSSDNENSLSSQLNSALAQQLGQVTTSLLEKHLNIKPTLEIEPGYQFNIVLTKDLVFGGSYKGWK
ncbi:MAG: conjugal transfer protein TrbI [Mailhella sp.]|nr:conjugal transfer protein TrbI [Mailhella sp.]